MRNLILDVLAEGGQKFATSGQHDPYANFNFMVEFSGKSGIHKSGWSSVSGIMYRADFKEYREGGNNGTPDQIYTESRFEPVTLKRGMSEDMDILTNISKSHGTKGIGIANTAKMDITVKVMDRALKKAVKKFTLRNAWITAYETGELNALGMEVLFDQITVSFTGVDF